jgi:thioredoxin reductase (NADPH)
MTTERGVLSSRFDQMFPVLSPPEVDRIRRFGSIERFAPGEHLARVGKSTRGMYVVISGRVAVVGRDALGRSMSAAEFARIIGVDVESLEVCPGEVIAELGHLSGQPGASPIDARAVDEVQAILVHPDQVRALLIAEADLGERILRALILRRVLLIELGFGGPVLFGPLRSPR